MENDDLLKALSTSFVDKSINSSIILQPSLLTNTSQKKFLSTIVDQLLECKSFIISVAFITYSGVNLLLDTFSRLEAKGISGKIITGDYLHFTQPKALRTLNRFKNIDVKLITYKDFHAKGYFFESDDNWNIIVGSSNLTQSALTKTEEWNIKFSSYTKGKLLSDILDNFWTLWNLTPPLSQTLEGYSIVYNQTQSANNLKSKLYAQYIENQKYNQKSYKPNKMQIKALNSLAKIHQAGKDKALIISATGSGKTVLSAYDVKAFNPKRILFIVHRQTIALKSLNTFKQIMPDKSYGLLTGDHKDLNADYIFSTIQTLVTHLQMFDQNHFDYIIIDEVHHGGAKTYQKVFNYFKPSFNLGMSATPQRTDGFDIFAMYNNTIAYEYHLFDALNEDILTPFHYFGVTDITVNNQIVDEKTTINNLTSNLRVKHIIEKIKFYGYDGDRLHGLMFVSSSDEGYLLSSQLNANGLKTIFIGAKDSQQMRLDIIDQFENGYFDYIITVDIFNEGIDIPCVNQIVLLRPTKSAIIYTQQIGRGLRKHNQKDFVVIIDFIGNYKNNYLNPIAISSNSTYNKDTLAKDIILNGIDFLSGECVIQFEEIVEAQLLEKISNTNFSTLNNIKKDFEYLSLKYNKTPKLIDFIENELISPQTILANKSFKNYAQIKSKFNNEVYPLNASETNFLNYFSQVIFPAKRLHEVEIVNILLFQKCTSLNDLLNQVNLCFISDQSKITINALKHLQRTIFTSLSEEKIYTPIITITNDYVEFSKQFKEALTNHYFKSELEDIIKVTRAVYESEGYEKEHLLTPSKMYTRKQAYKCSLHDFHNGYQVGGYTIFENEALIFITLDNSNSFSNFENEILNNSQLTWFSKAGRKLKNSDNTLTPEGQVAHSIIPAKIFIKRNSSESFYFLGESKQVVSFTEMTNDSEKYVVKFVFELNEPIDDSLLNYLCYKQKNNI